MNKVRSIAVVFGVVGILLSILLPRLASLSSNNRPATLVEDLANDIIAAKDVAVIKFMRERPGFGVGPEIHAVTSRSRITEMMSDLTTRLETDVYRGHRYRNHPGCLSPKQMAEILMVDGSMYTFYGYIRIDRDGYYASIKFTSRIQPVDDTGEKFWRWFWGSGCSITEYESREMVKFLRKYNPFVPENLKRATSPKKNSREGKTAPLI